VTWAAFAHGVVLAVGLIIALGPQNVFVFQQGAVQPRLARAAPTVLTAGLSDTLLVLLAVLGVSAVVLRVAWLQSVLFGAGFLFLLYVGWAIYTAPVVEPDAAPSDQLGAREQVVFTLSVSLMNPHAILDTVGVIGPSALVYTGADRWLFTTGCLLVSWSWFAGLAIAGRALDQSATADRWLRHLNTVSAVIIWAVAIYMGWQFLGVVRGQ
jgi:L-lysine exporter family protein LysE/ArgO